MGQRPPRLSRDDILAREHGTIRRTEPVTVALGYPAPYRVGASSLGAQTVYRSWNRVAGLVCERAFLERGRGAAPIHLLESNRPIGGAHALSMSLACETELAGAIALIRAAGMEPLARDRRPDDIPIVIGGPLTYLDPALVSPLADVVVVGESEPVLDTLGEALSRDPRKEALFDCLGETPGILLTSRGPQPAPSSASITPIEDLPAHSATWSPDTELRDLFLIEAARSCPRGCSFCVMSRKARPKERFRPVPLERLLPLVPEAAGGVGLVGAAVTDHPRIQEIVDALVDRGARVSLSSIRADRLTYELAQSLRRGGLRSLTVAADGCSERVRRSVDKGITSDHILEASRVARAVGLTHLKIYTMVGLPGEDDSDIDELGPLVAALAPGLKISVAAQAFVPKPQTPLAEYAMEDVRTLRRRLERLRRSLGRRARLISSSPRWAHVDWRLAHAGRRAARAAISAHEAGETYAAWRDAFENCGLQTRHSARKRFRS